MLITKPFFFKRQFTSSCLSLQKVRLEFFSKDDCSLCHKAKCVVDQVLQNKASLKNDVELTLIDITKPENKEWWNSYCFDVPVLHINYGGQKTPVKFMHRLDKDKVIDAINSQENTS